MFTSSFAWTSAPASEAITSFAFMFEEVPDPVWKTSMGNWSSNSPAATRSAACAMRSAFSASRSPSSPFTRAEAALMRPSQRATGTGIGSPETVKFWTAFLVSPPQSSLGTVSPTTWSLVAVGARLRLFTRGTPAHHPLPSVPTRSARVGARAAPKVSRSTAG